MGKIAGHFARVEPRRRVRDLVLGLPCDLPRKNCWSIAEWAGEASPDGMHLCPSAQQGSRGVTVGHSVGDEGPAGCGGLFDDAGQLSALLRGEAVAVVEDPLSRRGIQYRGIESCRGRGIEYGNPVAGGHGDVPHCSAGSRQVEFHQGCGMTVAENDAARAGRWMSTTATWSACR